MARNIRTRGIRRKEIDEDKLALAFLMLAKILHEQEQADAEVEPTSHDDVAAGGPGDAEAA